MKFYDSGHDNSLYLDCIAMLLFNDRLQKHLLKQVELHSMGKESEVAFCIFLFFFKYIKGQFGASRF